VWWWKIGCFSRPDTLPVAQQALSRHLGNVEHWLLQSRIITLHTWLLTEGMHPLCWPLTPVPWSYIDVDVERIYGRRPRLLCMRHHNQFTVLFLAKIFHMKTHYDFRFLATVPWNYRLYQNSSNLGLKVLVLLEGIFTYTGFSSPEILLFVPVLNFRKKFCSSTAPWNSINHWNKEDKQ